MGRTAREIRAASWGGRELDQLTCVTRFSSAALLMCAFVACAGPAFAGKVCQRRITHEKHIEIAPQIFVSGGGAASSTCPSRSREQHVALRRFPQEWLFNGS